jgi:hypothetical protein
MALANSSDNTGKIGEYEGKTIDARTLPDSGGEVVESDQENIKARLISVNDALRTVLAQQKAREEAGFKNEVKAEMAEEQSETETK